MPRTIAGGWHGSLGAGANKLRVVVSFLEKDGSYTGMLHSLDQGAKLAFDKVTLDGDRLRFEIARIGGSYDGRLDAGRRTLTGTWTQGGAAQPLALVLDGPDDPAPPKQPSARPLDAPIDVAIAATPVLARVGDGNHLVYELHVTNVSSRELTLKRIEILDAERKTTAGVYEGASLIEQTVRFGEPGAEGRCAPRSAQDNGVCCSRGST